jgi:hypothetical protein
MLSSLIVLESLFSKDFDSMERRTGLGIIVAGAVFIGGYATGAGAFSEGARPDAVLKKDDKGQVTEIMQPDRTPGKGDGYTITLTSPKDVTIIPSSTANTDSSAKADITAGAETLFNAGCDLKPSTPKTVRTLKVGVQIFNKWELHATLTNTADCLNKVPGSVNKG